MMFITPTPATSNDTAATPDSSVVIVRVVRAQGDDVVANAEVVRHVGSNLSRYLRRRRMSAATPAVSSASTEATMMFRREVTPMSATASSKY
jgi:hypothetical protein